MNGTRTTSHDKIEFRWRRHEMEYAERLASSAADEGRTEGDQARELLKDALSHTDRMEHAIETLRQELSQVFKQLRDLSMLKDGMKTIHENIYESRDELLTCIIKLLVDAGNLTPEDAEEWAKNTFNAE
jgi:hypothetical protein